MAVPQTRTFDALSNPGTGFPKYRLTRGTESTPVTNWTNVGVTQLTNAAGTPVPSYSVGLWLDPVSVYRIDWDPGDGTISTETFSGSAGLPSAGSPSTPGAPSVSTPGGSYVGLDGHIYNSFGQRLD